MCLNEEEHFSRLVSILSVTSQRADSQSSSKLFGKKNFLGARQTTKLVDPSISLGGEGFTDRLGTHYCYHTFIPLTVAQYGTFKLIRL